MIKKKIDKIFIRKHPSESDRKYKNIKFYFILMWGNLS